MEYRAYQRVTWLLERFSCVLLVFRPKSDGISCISISYVGFALLFVCFLGILVEKRWNIVHVNRLRALLQNWLNMENSFHLLEKPPIIYGRKWGESDKKTALKNTRIYNLYYFGKRRVGLLCVFDHCLCEQALRFWEQLLRFWEQLLCFWEQLLRFWEQLLCFWEKPWCLLE